MSETAEALQRKINSARELKSVVRTMKSLAALSVVQYERSVHSLSDYYRAVELGLAACFREGAIAQAWAYPDKPLTGTLTAAIVFGSDQGLVGQFNDHLSRFVLSELNKRPGDKAIWAIGERIYARLQDAGLQPRQLYAVPNSVAAITPLISKILIDNKSMRENVEVYIFHNQPRSGASYEPAKQRLLPLDEEWQPHSEPDQMANKNAATGRWRWKTDYLRADPRISLRIAVQGMRRVSDERKCEPPGRNAESPAEYR